ncbi:DUF1648 domain-containing protein [Timonella senegalensis]|uniref:DUF1648 domain-containing protein n=1 Tax=Timonella senegalensis TaxID=1465825 RepID=UPI0028A891FF|nr:DUF1648 domain-containing protein [Timonella senegalensis]
MMTHDSPARTARPARAFYLLALLPSIAILAVGVIMPLIWQPEMPETLPTHWGTNGPDAFGSFASAFIIPLAIMLAVIIILTIVMRFAGKDSSAQRIGIVTTTTLASLGTAITLTTGFNARGAVDPTKIDLPDVAIATGVVIGLLLGVVLAALLPTPKYSLATAHPDVLAPRTQLGEHETGVWLARQFSKSNLIAGVTAVVGLIVLAVVSKAYFALAIAALLSLGLLAMFLWDIRVDSSGLTVRSSIGLPKKYVPLAEIESAQVISVSPLTDFGGWGWRTDLNGTLGVVLRKGEALEVSMSDNRKFVVTVDDAAGAAGLLNTLVERSR